MRDGFGEVFLSACFWSAFSSWTVAQCTKMVCGFLETKRLDFHYLVSTGGMPSAHSASVCGLATSVGMLEGFGSAVFVVALGVALVTMFDASTVRRAAGLQASLLNDIVDELFKEHHFSTRKLEELLGHTRVEVLMGATVGVFTAMIVTSRFVMWRGM
jgi:acid phosphatase family membrane protein YuiD